MFVSVLSGGESLLTLAEYNGQRHSWSFSESGNIEEKLTKLDL